MEPTEADAERFKMYARLVRSIRSCDNPHEEEAVYHNGLLSRSALNYLYNLRQDGTLLPNLTRLQWLCSEKYMPYINLFTHSNLKDIRLCFYNFEGTSYPNPGAIIHQIANQAPNLDTFFVNSMFGQRDILQDITLALPHLRRLQILSLPRLWINPTTSRVLRANGPPGLVLYPYPAEFDHIGALENVQTFFNDVADMNPHGPALQSLGIDASLEDVTYLLYNPNALQDLTTLNIKILSPERPEAVHDLLVAASESLPHLSTLHLTLVPDELAQIEWHPTTPLITADDLAPLLDFAQLKHFKMDALTPVDISEAELTALIQGWAHLETFELCSQPVIEANCENRLTLSAIIPFTIFCPNLITLSLWIDATQAPLYPLSEIPAGIRFGEKFRTLDLGTSPINESVPEMNFISHYLSQFFPRPRPTPPSPSTDVGGDQQAHPAPDLRVFYRFAQDLAGIVGLGRLSRLLLWRNVAMAIPTIVRALADAEQQN